MIKVLFESSIFLHQKVGGISRYITTLNKHLFKYGVSSKIFSPLSINYHLDNDKNNIYFLKFEYIPRFCRKIFFSINNFLTLIYIFIKKPDILHFSYYNNSLAKFLNIPYIITVYDLIHEKINFTQKQFTHEQFKKKDILNKAKHIICISNQTKKDLIKIYKVNKNKISVVYLGTEKKKFKIKKKKKFILFVGSRIEYKNFEKLAQAFGNSKYLRKNYKIICFGGNAFKNQELKFFDKLGIKNKIQYLKGDDSQLEKLYKEASLYISVSLSEGFGLTLLEAMKFKCPVVCSDIPVFREIYKGGCVYIKPKNITSIQRGVENILKSSYKQKKLIVKSNKIIDRYNWEKCAFNTSEIYKKVKNS